MIYVPDIENYKCFVVRDETTIRAYKTIPQRNQDVYYRDYYYNSNYLFQDGTQSFGSYSTLPVCLDSSLITTDFVYRNDFWQILIIFVILCIFCFYLPFKVIICRFFRRFN